MKQNKLKKTIIIVIIYCVCVYVWNNSLFLSFIHIKKCRYICQRFDYRKKPRKKTTLNITEWKTANETWRILWARPYQSCIFFPFFIENTLYRQRDNNNSVLLIICLYLCFVVGNNLVNFLKMVFKQKKKSMIIDHKQPSSTHRHHDDQNAHSK